MVYYNSNFAKKIDYITNNRWRIQTLISFGCCIELGLFILTGIAVRQRNNEEKWSRKRLFIKQYVIGLLHVEQKHNKWQTEIISIPIQLETFWLVPYTNSGLYNAIVSNKNIGDQQIKNSITTTNNIVMIRRCLDVPW